MPCERDSGECLVRLESECSDLFQRTPIRPHFHTSDRVLARTRTAIWAHHTARTCAHSHVHSRYSRNSRVLWQVPNFDTQSEDHNHHAWPLDFVSGGQIAYKDESPWHTAQTECYWPLDKEGWNELSNTIKLLRIRPTGVCGRAVG